MSEHFPDRREYTGGWEKEETKRTSNLQLLSTSKPYDRSASKTNDSSLDATGMWSYNFLQRSTIMYKAIKNINYSSTLLSAMGTVKWRVTKANKGRAIGCIQKRYTDKASFTLAHYSLFLCEGWVFHASPHAGSPIHVSYTHSATTPNLTAMRLQMHGPERSVQLRLCKQTHTAVKLRALHMSVQSLHPTWHEWGCLHRDACTLCR